MSISMLITATQGLLLCFVSWGFSRLLRRLVIKTDLDNVAGPPSGSFIKGNFAQLFDVNGWKFHQDLAEQFGRVVGIHGSFGTKQLYVFDPKALHHIIIKVFRTDQNIFEETESFIAANRVSFGYGLLGTLGDVHRRQRKMLNPLFSIAHMRHMVPMFYDVGNKLHNAIQINVASGPQEIEILRWMTRAALEMIGQSGFGYSFDPLVEGQDVHPFSKAVKEFVPVSFKMAFFREYIFPKVVKIGTARFRRFVVDLIPLTNVRRLRDIVNVMDATSVEIYTAKKNALAQGDEAVIKQIGRGKDIMSILMKTNMEAADEDKLPETEILGQMSTFTFAAVDTTSNALSRILHLLATHPKAQETLRQELTKARKEHGPEIPYDELVALPFLDAVCRETLRLYPPVPTVSRVARQDVVMPLSVPIKGKDGSDIHAITVPKDTKIVISIQNANRDPALWGPDALEWKPERWMSPLPDVLVDARMPGVYSHLMTFLGGSRACIGFKFSQLEMKVIMSVLFSQFRFTPSKQEILWEMGGIVTPSLKGQPSKPQLPIIIERVEQAV
ncbi:Docosahexaenoic acid omega-hydroxylase CYP4F3 [Hypsizygus marmoreus]|uniref:Docosahexaenoic acid omega-hydroxylase CYP4F3 n=1 Tax=Hypsizygus marmoreus TaxID=39966 RepID=A0A369K274_HYPMA|nr:Docosahexaenoic acid omega-hydroxylase CYP4F3 [Hypsizygus marmoreus]